MRELLDHSASVHDGHRLREQMIQHGYVYLPGLLPFDAVQKVRGDVFGALGAAGWLDQEATLEEPMPTSRAVREGAPGYVDAYHGIQRLQSFHELAHTPVLTAVMQRIIDDPLLVHPRKIARTSLPRDDEYTPPHQDFRLIQGSVDTLTCWVPLGDCPASLGGLRVLDGSHADGLRAGDPGQGPGGLKVEVDDADARWATTDYRAGDVLIFTSLTVHGALRNDEDHLRFSADFRFQSLREPVTTESLAPHYTPQIPDWPELTDGWTSRSSVETPAGVVIAPMLPPLDPDLRAPASPRFTAWKSVDAAR